MDPANSFEPRLKISVLGGCKFQCEGHSVHLETAKTSALFAYLVLHSRPQPRHKLIGLFWGGQPEANARANLRHALWHIRRQFKCPDQTPIVLSDPQGIVFNPAADAWLDVQAFEHSLQSAVALTAAAAPATAAPRPDDRYALLRQAVDLYGGDLLEGVQVDDAPEFEQWLLVERERLRALAVETLQRLVGYSVEWGDYAPGLDYARRLLKLEPWLEEAHRQRMRLLALGGQRAAALAQYETCRRVLAEELNTEPGHETQALYESLRAGTEKNRAELAASRHKLPPQSTPFVGRAEELTRLAALLANPTCRLITLLGPGGIGKTRLAVRAAAESELFRDGIYFVPLAGVAASDLLVWAVADALGLALNSGKSPQAQLLDALRDKALLLLLDNFEHLLAGADLLAEILCAARGVKLLVTSRERLNLREEWLFSVEGLRYPPEEVEATSAAPLEQYAAIQLFVQGAQRVRLGFELAEADRSAVVRVCQWVEGMPLALELASNWVRLLTCQEVAGRVEQGVGFLTTALRDVPVRHRSMRAVFEQSWQMLSAGEREVFQRLTVFRGGFRPEAAEPVAGATLERLAALVDKSFLRRNPAGRYEVHELLRQYGAEKLSEAEAAEARVAHGAYFAQFLGAREDDLGGRRCGEALEEITADIENVRAGWEWAVQGRHCAPLEQSETSLTQFYELRSWHQEAEAVFERATAALCPLAPEPQQQRVLAQLYIRQAFFSDRLARYTPGVKAFEAGLAIARQIDDRPTLLRALVSFGSAHIFHGTYVEARQLLEEALEEFRQLDLRPVNTAGRDHPTSPLALMGEYPRARMLMSYLLYVLGEYPRARSVLEQTLEDTQAITFRDNITRAYHNLGLIAQAENNPELATQWFQRGLEFSRQLAPHTFGATQCICGLASVAAEQGQYEQAARLAEESLRDSQQVDASIYECLSLNTLGQCACAAGQFAEARRYYQESIQRGWETEEWPPLFDGVNGIAELEMKQGQLRAAAELLAFVIQHPSTIARDRDHARRLFAQLAGQLPPEALAAAQKRGAAAELSAVVERLLD